MSRKPIYRCKFLGLERNPDGCYQAEVVLKEFHNDGSPPGYSGRTSAVKNIDFDLGIIVTRNSIYLYDTEESDAG